MDDTFRRFFRAINPETFKQIFHDWISNLAKTIQVKLLAIDGKASRRSHDDGKNMLHMVSAFATEARIVLGQEKVAEKSNEITAIPKLLDLLDVRGYTITIDAMGCQFAIANKIVQKEANYIFALKGNQGNLSDDVTLYFSDSEIDFKAFEDYDKGHGRIETRKCSVCNNVAWLIERNKEWHSIRSIIRIEATREIKGKTTQETRYYISSLDTSPQEILKAVRYHWAIENSLHWILDMSFNEDYSRVRRGNAPQVMAIMEKYCHKYFNTSSKMLPLFNTEDNL